MPLIKSAIKRAKQADKRRVRRLPFKTQLKTMMRKISDFAKEGKMDEGRKILPQVFKAIDTAAKKNIIHKNNAARKKALVTRMVASK